jgi:hypothetical protein
MGGQMKLSLQRIRELSAHLDPKNKNETLYWTPGTKELVIRDVVRAIEDTGGEITWGDCRKNVAPNK